MEMLLPMKTIVVLKIQVISCCVCVCVFTNKSTVGCFFGESREFGGLVGLTMFVKLRVDDGEQ